MYSASNGYKVFFEGINYKNLNEAIISGFIRGKEYVESSALILSYPEPYYFELGLIK